jgi:hypothetical protein
VGYPDDNDVHRFRFHHEHAMTALLAFLRLAWPYLACFGIGLGTGGYLVGNHWESRYNALRASTEQGLADAQAAARKALQEQLEQFQATSANNAKVINDLQTQATQAAADSARDRELAQRLLNAASRDPRYHTVPEAGDQPAASPAGQPQSTEQLGDLLVATADESRACARQLNALIEEIRPQL